MKSPAAHSGRGFVRLLFKLFAVYTGFISPVFQVVPEGVAVTDIYGSVPGAWGGDTRQ